MARLVLVGSARSPIIITQTQLDAAGPDLRSSHFEHFRMTGLDLPEFDLRDVSFISGRLRACNLSTAKTRYLYSRRTSYDLACAMPRDTSSFNREMMMAILDQKARVLAGGAERIALEDVRDYGSVGHLRSWDDAIGRLFSVRGISSADVRAFFLRAFASHPKLRARLRLHLDRGLTRSTARQAVPTPAPSLPTVTPRRDRYAIARAVEAAVAAGDVLTPGLVAYVPELTPAPILLTTHNPGRRWDWWRQVKE